MLYSQMKGGATVATALKRRQERLDVRIAEDEKTAIDQAAALEGSNTSDFVRRSALKAAHETIQSHTVARLSLEDTRRFVAALKNPPSPNEKLRSLARDFGSEVGK
jgi:uncharacterized protein (DUF1778 family)